MTAVAEVRKCSYSGWLTWDFRRGKTKGSWSKSDVLLSLCAVSNAFLRKQASGSWCSKAWQLSNVHAMDRYHADGPSESASIYSRAGFSTDGQGWKSRQVGCHQLEFSCELCSWPERPRYLKICLFAQCTSWFDSIFNRADVMPRSFYVSPRRSTLPCGKLQPTKGQRAFY